MISRWQCIAECRLSSLPSLRRRARGQRVAEDHGRLEGERLCRAQLRGAVRPRPYDPDLTTDACGFRRCRSKCRFFWKRSAKTIGKADKSKAAVLSALVDGKARKTAEMVGLSVPRTRVLVRELVKVGAIAAEGESRARRYHILKERNEDVG